MHWYHWVRGNVAPQYEKFLSVASIHYGRSLKAKQREFNCLGSLFLLSLPGEFNGTQRSTCTHKHTHQWIGFAVQCSYVLQGSGWAVTSLHYRKASIIQYTISHISLFCMIYVGRRKMEKSVENQLSEWTVILKRSLNMSEFLKS